MLGFNEQYQWDEYELGITSQLDFFLTESISYELSVFRIISPSITVDLNAYDLGEVSLSQGERNGIRAKLRWDFNSQKSRAAIGSWGIDLAYEYWQLGKSNDRRVFTDSNILTITEPRSDSNRLSIALFSKF